MPASDGKDRPRSLYAGSSMEVVGSFLDFLRATLLWKMVGLTEEQARSTPTASAMSLLAIVRHSAHVERFWFEIQFAGAPVPPIWSREDPDADWRIEPGETLESILSYYREQTQRSRDLVAAAKWDDLCQGARSRELGRTLGWVMAHMVEEIARHCGHADIIREAVDGAVGE